MAAAPGWKVYDSFGTYQSSCKEVEAAAAVATFYGHGSTIRSGHPKYCIVWTEGIDGTENGNYIQGVTNYDQVAITIASRQRSAWDVQRQKTEAK